MASQGEGGAVKPMLSREEVGGIIDGIHKMTEPIDDCVQGQWVDPELVGRMADGDASTMLASHQIAGWLNYTRPAGRGFPAPIDDRGAIRGPWSLSDLEWQGGNVTATIDGDPLVLVLRGGTPEERRQSGRLVLGELFGPDMAGLGDQGTEEGTTRQIPFGQARPTLPSAFSQNATWETPIFAGMFEVKSGPWAMSGWLGKYEGTRGTARIVAWADGAVSLSLYGEIDPLRFRPAAEAWMSETGLGEMSLERLQIRDFCIPGGFVTASEGFAIG